MSAILKFDFQKRKQLRFSEVKLSKLHKKDPMLHMTTTFSLKQWETRTNIPIPHPLRHISMLLLNTNCRYCNLQSGDLPEYLHKRDGAML